MKNFRKIAFLTAAYMLASIVSVSAIASPNLAGEKVFATGPLVAKEMVNWEDWYKWCRPIGIIPAMGGIAPRIIYPPQCPLP